MIRLTFDTNVLISSTLWKNSVSRKLLDELILQSKEIFTSEEILQEYCKVLKRDFNFSKEEVEEKIELILSFVNVIVPSCKIEAVKEDPDDNKVIECAVESKSEYILSYDYHLLNLKDYQGIKIIKPEEAIGFINKS